MTAGNWPECINFTLSFEGGYDANSKDRGNWTSGIVGQGELKGTHYGIAAHVYPALDIKNLRLDEAKAIYRRDYWPKVAGDQQPDGVDLIAWDICVNSGASRAMKIEAQALGSNIKTAIGLAALAATKPDKAAIVKIMCAKRAAFYQGLSTFNTFGKGWLRRNAAAEARGVTMALRGAKATPADIRRELQKEAGAAKVKTKANAGGAAGSGGGAVAPTQTDTAWTFDWATVGEVAAVIILIGLAVYFVRKALQHNERANAYAKAIQGIIGA